ncbi:MAG: clostripain-related cysteine peptidase [Defluviitaleaceae bacterium]|nr:clostripain-related cysteine peptidase [Defluviitaleaceae bacterium]MCL2240879.1 clostripain-related cysteine peptidase [Defluviitaleaceae bacterium]
MKKNIFLLFIILPILVLTGGGGFNSYHTPKPYTIMIYMNGSDLESDFGAATDDLVEILDAGLDSRNAHVVILTGGTKRWMNDAIPEGECVIWEMVDGHLYEVESMGERNMGHPDTLRDFIYFGLKHFPAEKVGLILWDHGGGSIAGFGHDERFVEGTLTLPDMYKAFSEAGLRDQKLEFLGFDACLMGTVEMAVLASDFARVMIASEDLEPGDGWDYAFLGVLNENPHMDGFALGKVIVDTFMDFYGVNSDEILTLSVIDLARVKPVMDAMGRLVARDWAFRPMAIRRANTKTFGEGSPRDNYADMVDIGDMAVQLKDLFPRESAAVLRALKNCVVYNRHNSDVELYGLSTFYVYGGKSVGEESLRMYSALGMDADYTRFLHAFFDGLVRYKKDADIAHREWVLWEPITEDVYRMAGLAQEEHRDSLWPHIYGHWVSLFPVASTKGNMLYAIPVRINGRDADIITTTSRIKGIRHRDGNVIQKGYDPIQPGDMISFYSLEWNILTNAFTWHRSRYITVRGDLALCWAPTPDGYGIGERLTDIYRNTHYTLPG